MLRNRKHKECPMACKKCNKNYASPLDLKDNQKYLQLTSICRDFSKKYFYEILLFASKCILRHQFFDLDKKHFMLNAGEVH